MAVGTYGGINIQGAGNSYRARARFRDHDGSTREVMRVGQTKAAATRNLKTALAERAIAALHDGIAPTSTVAALAEQWLADVERDNRRAYTTLQLYRGAVGRYIKPRLGNLRLSEVRTSTCQRALQDVSTQHGPAAAKAARSALRGMFNLAARFDAITTNPVREVTALPHATKHQPRALTVDETDELCDWLRSDQRAVTLDLPDLVEWMLGTGCRIGETLAVRAAALDLEAGTVEINATLIRVKGHGLQIQERPKTAAGWRVLALPVHLVDMLTHRPAERRFRTVHAAAFASPWTSSLRDPSNTAADLRECLDRAGFPWVHSHTFRKTVATRLDEAGASPRQIADQLGHSQPSVTMDVYLGRKVVFAHAAEVLAR